jgi:hypothetical protein
MGGLIAACRVIYVKEKTTIAGAYATSDTTPPASLILALCNAACEYHLRVNGPRYHVLCFLRNKACLDDKRKFGQSTSKSDIIRNAS